MDLLLDLDGVLVNFLKQVCLYHNRPYEPETITQFSIEKIWGITPQQFWDPLRGREFWSTMEPHDYAHEFYQELTKLGEVTILTAPNEDPECIPGKIEFLNEVLGIPTSAAVFANRKHLFANRRSILIDDRPENIRSFSDNGGYASITFPQPWNGGKGDYLTVLGTVENIINNPF